MERVVTLFMLLSVLISLTVFLALLCCTLAAVIKRDKELNFNEDTGKNTIHIIKITKTSDSCGGNPKK